MSSRNIRLSKEARKLAPRIYEILRNARQQREALTPQEVKDWVIHQFKMQPEMELEYFEIVDDKELTPVKQWDDKVNKVGCLAVLLGGVRLLDNLNFN
jgi:pantoate--beta-alanine ligase